MRRLKYHIPDNIDALFVDLDGVLVDFHSAVAKLWGLNPEKLKEEDWMTFGKLGPARNQEEFWTQIRKQGTQWWTNLPKLSWADKLWASCNASCEKVIVLTSPGPFPESAAGKYQWVRQHLSTTRMLIGQPKEVCSKPGHILIDDRNVNLEPWKKAGGYALSLRRPWNKTGFDPRDIIEALEIHASKRK